MAEGQSKQVTFTKWDVKPGDMKVELLSADGNITYQMKPYEFFVYVTQATTFGMTVTLPPVSECIGGMYHIYVRDYVDANIVIEDFKGDAGLSNITLDVDDQYVLLYSTGEIWIQTSAAGYT